MNAIRLLLVGFVVCLVLVLALGPAALGQGETQETMAAKFQIVNPNGTRNALTTFLLDTQTGETWIYCTPAGDAFVMWCKMPVTDGEPYTMDYKMLFERQ